MRNNALRGITLPLFEADGTIDLDDQQFLLGTYSGIAFATDSWDYELPAWWAYSAVWQLPFLPDDSATIESEDLQEIMWQVRIPTFVPAAGGVTILDYERGFGRGYSRGMSRAN